MTLHPAARATLERVLGIKWRYELLAFDSEIGVCATTNAGKRLAARFSVRSSRGKTKDELFALHADCIEQAKEAVLLSLLGHGRSK